MTRLFGLARRLRLFLWRRVIQSYYTSDCAGGAERLHWARTSSGSALSVRAHVMLVKALVLGRGWCAERLLCLPPVVVDEAGGPDKDVERHAEPERQQVETVQEDLVRRQVPVLLLITGSETISVDDTHE